MLIGLPIAILYFLARKIQIPGLVTVSPMRTDSRGTAADAVTALQIAVGSRPFDDAADVSGDKTCHIPRCADDPAGGIAIG